MKALALALLAAALQAQAPRPAQTTAAAVPTDPVLAERLRMEAIAAAESQCAQAEGTWTFRVVAPIAVPPHGKESLRVEFSHLSRKELTGRFFAAFRIFEGGRLIGSARVDMEGSWKGSVLQAKTPLARKSIPEADQLESVPFEGAPPPGFLQEIPAGYRLRNAIQPGKVITRADLEPIPLISAGDRVRLELVSGGLVIATEALARSQGALGERVRLELPSRKQVQGVVTAEGEARISWR